MTHDEMIAVIQAHKDGANLECYNRNDNVIGWSDTQGYPIFNFAIYNYRVKPNKPRIVSLTPRLTRPSPGDPAGERIDTYIEMTPEVKALLGDMVDE